MTDGHAWIDAGAGVAGDMLLGALLDAGADLATVQRAVDAVVPDAVRIDLERVTRAGMSAARALVEVTVEDPPHRRWATIRKLLAAADLPDRVRDRAHATFARLADVEGQVHGIDPEDVSFHEVGALDSIADVVGVCAALESLDVATVSAGPVAVGSGRARMAHGEVGVPVPAVLELARGWRTFAGGTGELATPTGMALIVTLSAACTDLPDLEISAVGSGAGTRDVAGRANVTRVVLGRPAGGADRPGEPAVVLEANVDDQDPRLWPGVLDALLQSGASDAWLTPVIMKKGRPGHVLSVLAPTDRVPQLLDVIMVQTTTIGVRQHPVTKYAMPRAWVEVVLDAYPVSIKLAHRDGRIRQVSAEFDAVAEVAARLRRPTAELLRAAESAATEAGLIVGAPLPADARSVR